MDDAISEVYSSFFVAEEGIISTFRALGEVMAAQGLFCSLYTDRGSHYWHTPEADGGVDKDNPTQVGRVLARLGIEPIAAYSPEGRGRSERMFGTLPLAEVFWLAQRAVRRPGQGRRLRLRAVRRRFRPAGITFGVCEGRTDPSAALAARPRSRGRPTSDQLQVRGR